uniref:sciellin isoform X3 n=1 Tax=Pristiophorus japonicus TaxID=55135 RepID=UPI00398E52F4
MSLFKKLTETFADRKNPNSKAADERDEVLQETKKRARLLKDGDWIRNRQPTEESPNLPTDVNYGRTALNRVKSDESLNSDPTGKLKSPTKYDSIDGRRSSTWLINGGRNKVALNRFRSEEFLSSGTADLSKTQRSSTLDRPARDTGSTNVTSPVNKYSSLDRQTRTSPYKADDLPKMTIITSDSKIGSPTNKSLLSRPTPDGQVTTQEKSPSKPILKWGSQKDETSTSGNLPRLSTLERNSAKTPTKIEAGALIDLTPDENTNKRNSDFMSKLGSKSLIDLSITPEKPSQGIPTPTIPGRTSSLVNLSPPIPEKPQRTSGERDNISPYTTASTKTTYNPRLSRNSGDWDNTNSYTPTTTTKTTYDPSNNGDLDNTSSYPTSTKTTYDPSSRDSRSSGDWENTSPYTSTKTSPERILKSTRSTSEHAFLNDEPPTYKSPTTYTKPSRNSSSGSLSDKSPVTDENLYNSRSSYKENSPPSEQLSDDDESSADQSPNYFLSRNKSSRSSLSDGKAPAKVITITTGFSSAEQASMDKNVCSQCYKPINKGAKMILDDLNINCHAACFKCQICKTSLENLNAGDNFWVHHHIVHCEQCYDKVKAQWSY